MKIGSQIEYRGYTITHPCKEDYITEIAHDSLKEAKGFIDDLMKHNLILSEEEVLQQETQMKGPVIHLRDKGIKTQPLHFESRTEHLRLTDDPKEVTCKRCLAMIRRKERVERERISDK